MSRKVMVTTIFILIYFVISSESFNPLKYKNSNNHHHHHYSQSTTHIDKLKTMSAEPSISSKCQQQQEKQHHRRKLYNQNDEQDNLLFSDGSKEVEEEMEEDYDNQGEGDVQHYYYLSNDYKQVIKEDVVFRRERRHKNNQRLDIKQYRSLPDEAQSFSHHHHRHHHHHSQVKPHWPVKHEAVVEGDVIIGGLMMVHSREDTITCGPIMPQGGIQALEAMLFTIDAINKLKLLPNITLGAHILDDCDKDSYGLEMAVDFIKGIHFVFIYELLLFQ